MTENLLRKPRKITDPTEKDFAAIEALVRTGPQSKRAKTAAKLFASKTISPIVAFRLYRAAAQHGHHTIGQIFVERHAELMQAGAL